MNLLIFNTLMIVEKMLRLAKRNNCSFDKIDTSLLPVYNETSFLAALKYCQNSCFEQGHYILFRRTRTQ